MHRNLAQVLREMLIPGRIIGVDFGKRTAGGAMRRMRAQVPIPDRFRGERRRTWDPRRYNLLNVMDVDKGEPRMVNLDSVYEVRADGVRFRPWEGSSPDMPRSVRRYAKDADRKYYPVGLGPEEPGMKPHRDMAGPAGERRLRRALRSGWGRYDLGGGPPQRLRQFAESGDEAQQFAIDDTWRVRPGVGLQRRLYHGTTSFGKALIKKQRQLKSAEEPDVYLTNDMKGGGYGDGSVVRGWVRDSDAVLDDEFPDGRMDYRVSAPQRKVPFDPDQQFMMTGSSSRAAGKLNHLYRGGGRGQRQNFFAPIAALAGRALAGQAAKAGGGRLAQGAANMAGQGAANSAMDRVGFAREDEAVYRSTGRPLPERARLTGGGSPPRLGDLLRDNHGMREPTTLQTRSFPSNPAYDSPDEMWSVAPSVPSRRVLRNVMKLASPKTSDHLSGGVVEDEDTGEVTRRDPMLSPLSVAGIKRASRRSRYRGSSQGGLNFQREQNSLSSEGIPPELLEQLLARRQLSPAGSIQSFARDKVWSSKRPLMGRKRVSRGTLSGAAADVDEGFAPTVVRGSTPAAASEAELREKQIRRALTGGPTYDVRGYESDGFVPVRIDRSGQNFDRWNEDRRTQRENIFDNPVKEAEEQRKYQIGRAESQRSRERHRREMDEMRGARNREADREIERYRRNTVTPAAPERKQAERGALRDDVTRRRRQMVDRDRVNRSLRGGPSGRRGRIGVPDSAMETPDFDAPPRRQSGGVRPGLDALGSTSRGSWDAESPAPPRLSLSPEPLTLRGGDGPESSLARRRAILNQVLRNRMERRQGASGGGQPRTVATPPRIVPPGDVELGRSMPTQRGLRGGTVYGDRLRGLQGGLAGYRPGMRRLMGLEGVGVGRGGRLQGIRRGGRGMRLLNQRRGLGPRMGGTRQIRRFEQNEDDQRFGLGIGNTLPGRAVRALGGAIDAINPRRTVETLRGKGYGPRASNAIGWGSHIADATVVPSFGLPVTSALARRLPARRGA